jgi:hypothetical protein
MLSICRKAAPVCGSVHYLWEELSTAAIYHTRRLEGNALMVAEAQAGVAGHRWR